MRIWWVLVVGCGPSEPARTSAPPKPEAAPVAPTPDAAPAWPPLGTDLAVVRSTDVTFWTASMHPMEEGTEVAVSFPIRQAMFGGDHRLYTMKDDRVAAAIDASGVREIAIAKAKPSKERGYPFPPNLVAYADGSVWFVECWGPRFRPKSSSCATSHRVRLDAPGEDYAISNGLEVRVPRPFPTISAPDGVTVTLDAGQAKVTCGDTSVVRERQYGSYSTAYWLLREPPLYALGSDEGWFETYRRCDPGDARSTSLAAGNGYYAFHTTAWTLARDGAFVRELGGDQLIFGP